MEKGRATGTAFSPSPLHLAPTLQDIGAKEITKIYRNGKGIIKNTDARGLTPQFSIASSPLCLPSWQKIRLATLQRTKSDPHTLLILISGGWLCLVVGICNITEQELDLSLF